MTETEQCLTPDIEACRARLEQDLLDVAAAARLCELIASSPQKTRPLAVLAEVAGVLEGGAAWRGSESGGSTTKIPPALYDSLVLHPREKQARQHQFGSLAGRALHLLQGNDTARAIARVTERATPERYGTLCRHAADCATALAVTLPAIHVARGEEPLFALLLDRWPFLCVHTSFIEGEFFGACLSSAELTFALGRTLQPIRGGHAALSQLGSERLESMLLDELPFLVRTPIKIASRAVSWTRANEAVKSLGERLAGDSTARRVVSTVGSLLPAKDQETVLPEVVHEWVRRFIEGVEWSADRAGLMLCGSPGAACAALLALSPALSPRRAALQAQGARQILQNPDTVGRANADRLRELLRFALSREYLAYGGHEP